MYCADLVSASALADDLQDPVSAEWHWLYWRVALHCCICSVDISQLPLQVTRCCRAELHVTALVWTFEQREWPGGLVAYSFTRFFGKLGSPRSALLDGWSTLRYAARGLSRTSCCSKGVDLRPSEDWKWSFSGFAAYPSYVTATGMRSLQLMLNPSVWM
jgi:hypothetical protein